MAKAKTKAPKGTATKTTAQGTTANPPQSTADAVADQTQGNAPVEQQAPPPVQEVSPMSVFDQAVRFCCAGLAEGGATATERGIWDELQCEDMPPKLAVAAFDCGLKQGVDVAQRLLAKVIDAATPDEALTAFLSWRLRRYAFQANAATNMREWSGHILRLQAFLLIDLHA